jgi:hypothetical protein
LTTSGKYVVSLSPMYCSPVRAFSGEFGPAGSRQVLVGVPLGSVAPPWTLL